MTTPADAPMESAALLRFISGESPADERAVIEQWMDAEPAHRAEVHWLTRAWQLAAQPRELVWDPKVLWRRIEEQLDPARSAHGSKTDDAVRARRVTRPALVLVPASRRTWWSSVPVRVAAAAVLVAAGAAVVLRHPATPSEQSARAVMRTYTTQPGERAELRLADGSRVVLNAASTLRIPATFGRHARDLYLTGAAYFEVEHDAAQPLRVHTAHGITEDLGTRFVIHAYTSDTTERVAVAEGEVSLRSTASAPVVLEAGDVGRVSATGMVSVSRHVATEQYFSWIKGVLEFDNVALGDAVPILERQYNLNIRITDSALARKRFTGSFTTGDVDQLMRSLAFLLDARYERPGGGRDLILTPR